METIEEQTPKLDITRVIEEYATLGAEIINYGRKKGNIIKNDMALKDFVKRESSENPEYESKEEQLSSLESRYEELCAANDANTLNEAIAQVKANITDLTNKIREAEHTKNENERTYQVAAVKDPSLAQSCRISIETCEANIKEAQSTLITYEHFLQNLVVQVQKKTEETKKHI